MRDLLNCKICYYLSIYIFTILYSLRRWCFFFLVAASFVVTRLNTLFAVLCDVSQERASILENIFAQMHRRVGYVQSRAYWLYPS